MTSDSQIRAALALLNWSANDLAQKVGAHRVTIQNLMHGRTKYPDKAMLQRITEVITSNGIELTEGDGIRRRPKDIEIFDGITRFHEFLQGTYSFLEKFGGEVCIYVKDEHDLQRACGSLAGHRKTMYELSINQGVTGRILAVEGEFKSDWAKMRQTDDDLPHVSFYIYGDNFALISFEGTPWPHVVLHKASPFAQAYKATFNAAWEKAKVM